MVIDSWIQEWKDDAILEKLGVEPGDLHRAVENADWLLYCLSELARLYSKFELIKETEFLRKRVQSGIKAELVELTQARRNRQGEGPLPLLRRLHEPEVDPGGERGEARQGREDRTHRRQEDQGTGREMRTNGFALFRGPGARTRAEDAAARVGRYGCAILTDPGVTFGTTGALGRETEACAVAYSLEAGGGLPLVHGFAESPEGLSRGEATGEFAFVTDDGGRVFAGRDSMGTRPLYTDAGCTCVASDHRFFPRVPVLLPRGAIIDVGSGERALTPRVSQAPAVQGMDETVNTLCGLLEESVAHRVKGRKRVAVSFSGGLDSSLIAMLAAKHAEVVLCSAYADGSSDQGYTTKAAERLGLEHRGTVIGASDAARGDPRDRISPSSQDPWTGLSGASTPRPAGWGQRAGLQSYS